MRATVAPPGTEATLPVTSTGLPAAAAGSEEPPRTRASRVSRLTSTLRPGRTATRSALQPSSPTGAPARVHRPARRPAAQAACGAARRCGDDPHARRERAERRRGREQQRADRVARVAEQAPHTEELRAVLGRGDVGPEG